MASAPMPPSLRVGRWIPRLSRPAVLIAHEGVDLSALPHGLGLLFASLCCVYRMLVCLGGAALGLDVGLRSAGLRLL